MEINKIFVNAGRAAVSFSQAPAPRLTITHPHRLAFAAGLDILDVLLVLGSGKDPANHAGQLRPPREESGARLCRRE